MEHLKMLKDLCEDLMKQVEEAKTRIPTNRLMEPHEAEHLDYLLHSLKSLKVIIPMMEHENEEGEYKAGRYREGNYGAGDYREDGSYGARMRDSRGRFRDGGDGYGMYDPMGRSFYRDGGTHQLKESLRRTMEMAQNPEEKRVLEDAMKRLESI